MQYVIDNKGLDTEDSYPYYEQSYGPDCTYDPANKGAQISGNIWVLL